MQAATSAHVFDVGIWNRRISVVPAACGQGTAVAIVKRQIGEPTGAYVVPTMRCQDTKRNIRYAEIVIPVGECSSSSTAASNLSVRSAISASSSSTDSLTEAEHVAFRKEFFGPISKEEIKHTLDTVLARYPPSEPAWPIDPRWCNLCQKWLRDEAQYDDHLINHTRRKHAKRIALAQGGRVEQ